MLFLAGDGPSDEGEEFVGDIADHPDPLGRKNVRLESRLGRVLAPESN